MVTSYSSAKQCTWEVTVLDRCTLHTGVPSFTEQTLLDINPSTTAIVGDLDTHSQQYTGHPDKRIEKHRVK